MRMLSSPLTFVFKVVFPAVWISGFGAGTVLMWLVPTDDPEEPPVLVFTVGWVLGSACLLWMTRNLKVVGLDGDWLWISNFRRWVPVALREIESVDELPRLNVHPIILYLDRRSAFGKRIIFMPRGRGLPSVSHPLVGELRRLARDARRQSHGEVTGVSTDDGTHPRETPPW